MGDKQDKKRRIVNKEERKQELYSAAREIFGYLESKRAFLADAEGLAGSLTGRERLRLYGAGVKNYGFIELAYDIAKKNPRFMPRNFDIEKAAGDLQLFDAARQLVFEFEQYLRAASDVMMTESDTHYHNALRIYGSLREQSRNRVEGAQTLFSSLQKFFHRAKRKTEQPGKKQIEKDAKKLLSGKADGRLVIQNESPRVSGGYSEVASNVKK